MCGRFTLTVDLPTILRLFQAKYQGEGFEFSKRYNIAPGQDIPVITSTNSKREILLMRWGLIPPWAKNATIGYKMINARAETIDQRPAFKQSFLLRRCLIPTDGFYEWKKQDGQKTPIWITLPSKEVFAFAGIYARWSSPEGIEIRSFSIITTGANNTVRMIHDRMPVILAGESDYRTWLEQAETSARLKQLLHPYRGQMAMHKVSSLINSPKFDHSAAINEIK
ncbi:MAG: SOS response-associated peptidase [Desulfotomaculaceae bacterium]|nr:SOS response-associated peptidase [Desulfotomaculaceae bacterium]